MAEPATALSSEPAPELYLITRLGDERAWSMCRRRQVAGPLVRVVLLHDAVLETEVRIRRYLAVAESSTLPLTVLACARDAIGRGVEERWALIDYQGIIKLSAASHPVISW
ncbi:MAG: hypothetical protein ACYDEA_01385 [Candidatus Dormibacteria bacterium]